MGYQTSLDLSSFLGMKKPWTYRTYAKLEKIIQENIIYIGKEIIDKNWQREIELWPILQNGVTDLVSSFDFGWQQRGSGFTYNSFSGHGFLVGARSKR